MDARAERGIVIREVEPTAAALERIGRLRIAVWDGEGVLADDYRARGVWTDEFDVEGRHWLAEAADGTLVACARLTVHPTAEASPDGYVWLRAGLPLEPPVANIAKLVVHADARGLGLASELNRVRIAAARALGARTLTVTASKANARLLAGLGFRDTGLVVTFPNRPGFPFHALEMRL